jgi:OmcA/MtrC family decaheme c-type cytochrome
VTFKVKDDAGNAIMPSQMNSLGLIWGGPTTDYASYYREDARMATANPDGSYSFTSNTAVPAEAKGSSTVGMEGYRNITLTTGPGETSTVRDAGDNVTFSFAITDAAAVARRVVVDTKKCLSCHDNLALHGGNRNNNVQHCILCHNPNQTDTARRPADQQPAESVDFKRMIHRIHAGEELTTDFTVFGFGNVAHNYNEVRFPAHRQNCEMCHLPGTFTVPASTAGRLPTITPRSLIDPTPPISAACTGCHDSQATLAHVALNTTTFGEACAVCHGEGRDFAVSTVHFRRPDIR